MRFLSSIHHPAYTNYVSGQKPCVVFTLTQIQEVLELCAGLRAVQELKLVIANPYLASSLGNALILTKIRVVLSAKLLPLYPVINSFVGKATDLVEFIVWARVRIIGVV